MNNLNKVFTEDLISKRREFFFLKERNFFKIILKNKKNSL